MLQLDIDLLVHLKATDSDIIDYVGGNVWTKSKGFKVIPDEGVFGDRVKKSYHS